MPTQATIRVHIVAVTIAASALIIGIEPLHVVLMSALCLCCYAAPSLISRAIREEY